MKVEKSLQEVRDWKEQLNKELDGLSKEEIFKKLKAESAKINKSHNLNLRKLSLTPK